MLNELPDETRKFADPSCLRAGEKLLRDLFSLNELVGTASFFGSFSEFVHDWIPYNSISMYEFARNMQPRVLHSWGETYDQDMIRYLGGLYLVDPMFELFEHDDRRGVFRYNLERRDDYDVPEIFVRYWKQVPGCDEIGLLTPLAEEEDRCVHISVHLSLNEADANTALHFMEACFDPITRMFQRHLRPVLDSAQNEDVQRQKVHEKVSGIMSDFGRDVLTAREREITQLLLKGHSAKSIARLLEISPGTAAIHRSNIYNKLQVSGQGDLFALFVARLVSI